MLKAIALSVLFMCALASTADAQPKPNCNVPLGHIVPATCTPEEIAARRQAIINGYRGVAEETQIYRDYRQEQDDIRRSRYRAPTDDIRFGVHPGPMGTLHGRPMGRAGQCDRNGCYGSGSYAYDGYDYGYYGDGWYRRGNVYIYPYDAPGVDMNVKPKKPDNVYAGKNDRDWHCRRLERVWWCEVNSSSLLGVALGAAIIGAAIAVDKSN